MSNRTRVFDFPSSGGFQFPVPPPFQDTGEIDLHQTSLRWDDEEFDNGAILEELIQDAAAAGKTLKARLPGTICVGTCDAAVTGHVRWDFVPGVQFYGLPGFDGTIITVRGHVPSGNRVDDFHARNFWIDNSQRPFVAGEASGSGLSVSNFNYVYTENFRGYAGTDFRGVDGVQHGDSAMTQNTVNSSLHVNFAARGQPDLGMYITGDPPYAGHPGDDNWMERGGHTMINPRMLDCSVGIKAVRQARRFRIFGGEMIRCSIGVLGVGFTQNLPASPEMIVVGLHGKRLGSRLVCVGPLMKATIIGCQLEDWGYQPTDGTMDSETASSSRAAYSMEGGSDAVWNGCRAWFRDWDPIDEAVSPDHILYGFRLKAATWTLADAGSPVTYQSSNNVFSDCVIEGANRGYFEEDLSDSNKGVIHHRTGATTIGIELRAGSDSQVIDGEGIVNNSVPRLDPGGPLVIGYASARINRLQGAWAADQNITFSALNKTVWGREYHFSNEITGTPRTITITQLGSGGASTKALAVGQWADVIWNGATLELLRFGSV